MINLSAVYLTANPALHSRSKHFQLDYHYVRERVALGPLVFKHIPAALQIADIFTKSLPQQPFFDLRFKLGVSLPPATSLRGCISHNSNSLNQKEDLSESKEVKNGPQKTELEITSEVGLSKIHKPNVNYSATVIKEKSRVSSRDVESLRTALQGQKLQLHNHFNVLGSNAIMSH